MRRVPQRTAGRRGLGAAAALVAWALAACLAAARADDVDPLTRWIDAIAARQDPRVAEGLARIDGNERRLLALRSYLRSARQLAERWSWTDAQIDAYRRTREYRELQAEIERVRAAFAAANPGYQLWVNPRVRSLDVQVEHWNTNESVGAAAAELAASFRTYVAAAPFASKPEDAALSAAEKFLLEQRPVPTPTIAAPGLSPHGQMRAIDFQVESAGRIVADTQASTIAETWDAAGWTTRLEAAVRAGSPRFVGPLESPREPWHYTYVAEAMSAD